MKSSSAGEGSKSLSGFFNRSVTLSDLQADPRRDVGDLGSRRLQPTAEPIPEALFGFDGQAWDAGQYAREGPGSKGRYDAFVRNTTLPTVRREKARRLARPGESPGKLLGRLRKAKQPRESEILDHNLRTIGHVPVASERPNIRKSALRLERRYRSAMAVVDGRDPAAQSVAETIDRIASQPAGESEVATDYLACCSTVEAAFGERRTTSTTTASSSRRCCRACASSASSPASASCRPR